MGNINFMSCLGGAGNDRFFVQSNVGELDLQGSDGDDYFSVRSFEIEPGSTIPRLDLDKSGAGQQAIEAAGGQNNNTEIQGKLGDDAIQLDENAKTNIDGRFRIPLPNLTEVVLVLDLHMMQPLTINDTTVGGEGFNTLVVIGTEVSWVD